MLLRGGTRDTPKNVCLGGYDSYGFVPFVHLPFIFRSFGLFVASLLFMKGIWYLTNKEASTVFCSVVKHAGNGRARKKCRGNHETQSSVFPHFLSAIPLPKCFTAEQSTVEASLFVFW